MTVSHAHCTSPTSLHAGTKAAVMLTCKLHSPYYFVTRVYPTEINIRAVCASLVILRSVQGALCVSKGHNLFIGTNSKILHN